MKLEQEYAIPETAQEASVFSDITCKYVNGIPQVSRTQMRLAIQPKEGRWLFAVAKAQYLSDVEPPEMVPYAAYRKLREKIELKHTEMVDANELTIGDSGHIRTLLNWVNEHEN